MARRCRCSSSCWFVLQEGCRESAVDHPALQTVYIPRQAIVRRIVDTSQLNIFVVTTAEINYGRHRAWIDMSVPPDSFSAHPVPRTFYGDEMPSQYASVESAAEVAIRFLCAHKLNEGHHLQPYYRWRQQMI